MNNVTLIDDLPSLDELEVAKPQGLSMIPQNEIHKYQKFIRNSGYNTPEQAGMQSDKKNLQPHYDQQQRYPQQRYQQIHPQMHSRIHAQIHPQMHAQMHPHYHQPHQGYYDQQQAYPQNFQELQQDFKYNPYLPERVYENFENENKNENENEIKEQYIRPERIKYHNCIDIAEHAHNCVVCSKLYTNNNTIYILIIVFLAIVNLLLLKRILDVEK